jgi:putative transposase
MDDARRYIVGYALLIDKTAQTTTNALLDTLGKGLVPRVMGSDNGGEFRGTLFMTALNQFGIRAWYTDPYTPQQNGKIERFWGTMESTLQGNHHPDQIASFISYYNEQFVHQSLGMTLAMARDKGQHYTQMSPEDLHDEISLDLKWT